MCCKCTWDSLAKTGRQRMWTLPPWSQRRSWRGNVLSVKCFGFLSLFLVPAPVTIQRPNTALTLSMPFFSLLKALGFLINLFSSLLYTLPFRVRPFLCVCFPPKQTHYRSCRYALTLGRPYADTSHKFFADVMQQLCSESRRLMGSVRNRSVLQT